MMVALVGAVTFVVGSLAAITTSEAKRVLAWSTVANLGLIVLCGGIGTYEAVWAGILLIIFHAVAKCLLFLCVGVVEHKLHSRKHRRTVRAGRAHAARGDHDADRMRHGRWHVDQQMGGAQGRRGCLSLAVGLHRLRQRGHTVLLGQMDGQTDRSCQTG